MSDFGGVVGEEYYLKVLGETGVLQNFLGFYEQPGTVSAPSGIAAGNYLSYRGQIYYWDGARWLDNAGIGADIPIYFMRDPFANAEPAEWGKPFPLWGNGTVSSGAVPGLHTHVNQMNLLTVTAYMEQNTELEIPLIDDDGNPFIDPAVPPMSYMRYLTSVATDRVSAPYTSGSQWSDRYCAVAAYIGNNESVTDNEYEAPMFSHVFRIEKDPVPHWVLRLSYYFNKLTDSGGSSLNTTTLRTLLVSVAGGVGAVNTAQTASSGSSGVAGHWRVIRNFWTQLDPGDAGNTTLANLPVYYHDEDYVPAYTGSPTTFYLTDTGLTGGTTLFSTTYVPMVRFFGNREWQADHSGTETSYQSCSLGCGFQSDGIWAGHFASGGTGQLSIQHPDFDEYGAISVLTTNGSRWALDLYQYMDATNVTGSQINATGSPPDGWERQFFVHAFGRNA